MADVFVSYKAEDRRRIKPLVDALQADGYSVWWDEQIGGGSAWRQEIETELNAARCVIVVWSKRSVGPEGTFVQDEATRAQQRHVYIPVTIDKVHLPLGFGETQALALVGWHGNRSDPRYRSVLAAVLRNTGEEGARPQSGASKASMDRRTAIAGGAVAAIAVAGVGGWALLKSSAAGASSDSIAVLPFANLSGDPAQAYFSDGVAEEIRSSLSRVAGLKVVGRTSSEAVRNEDAQAAAKRLDVANILTGSVRQSPSTIRITAELIDGRSGLDRWSQDYDRSPGDAIKIQTDIAQNVATSLSVALGRVARSVVTVGGTQNANAQRFFIEAGEIGDRSNKKEDFEKALDLLDSAIALDPRYADAYARKSLILSAYGNSYANAEQLAANRAESLKLARTSLEISPDLARGHSALSFVYADLLQIGPAYVELKRARQLAPGDAHIVAAFGDAVSSLGDVGGALSLADQAIALDPLNPVPYGVRLNALFHGRRYPQAIAYAGQLAQKLRGVQPDEMTIADSLLLLGRFQEAQAHYNAGTPDYWRRLTGEAILRTRTGDRAGAEQKLGRLRQLFGDAASTQFGEIYAQMGDKERAFAALDRGYEIKDAGLNAAKVDAFLDPLRSDPRFTAFLRKMNFPSL
ncbi:MAG TPA: TIR domain-containing protein [Sphingomicrobium sp.]|jgi:serine/threonine-protein kinase|nr:TIR domain-containing protein [Sphingomicrobium sp.]